MKNKKKRTEMRFFSPRPQSLFHQSKAVHQRSGPYVTFISHPYLILYFGRTPPQHTKEHSPSNFDPCTATWICAVP